MGKQRKKKKNLTTGPPSHKRRDRCGICDPTQKMNLALPGAQREREREEIGFIYLGCRERGGEIGLKEKLNLGHM